MNRDPITDTELEELERDVLTALTAGDASRLTQLGEGEISLVLAGGDDRSWACKRLPPFTDSEAAERYASTIERYLDELTSRGIEVVHTTVRRVAGDAGRTVLYCVQPVLAPDVLGVTVARRDTELGAALLERIVDVILGSVDERFGLDAQLSNWALVDDRPVYLDVTTPLLRDGVGADELDTDVFLASLPWLLRPAVAGSWCPASSTGTTTSGSSCSTSLRTSSGNGSIISSRLWSRLPMDGSCRRSTTGRFSATDVWTW